MESGSRYPKTGSTNRSNQQLLDDDNSCSCRRREETERFLPKEGSSHTPTVSKECFEKYMIVRKAEGH